MLHEVFFQPPFLPLRAERIPLGPLFCDTGRKDTTRGMITSNFRPSEMLRFSPCQCLLPPRCCPRSTWRSPSRPPSDRLFPARQVSWSPAFASDAPGAFTALRSSLSLARVLRGGAASALDVEGLSCWLTGTPFVTRVQLLAGRSTLDASGSRGPDLELSPDGFGCTYRVLAAHEEVPLKIISGPDLPFACLMLTSRCARRH